MMLALVATAAASQHSTVRNNGYDMQSELDNQCYWISVQQCLELHHVANVSVEDLREVVRRHPDGEVNECTSRGCDLYEPNEITHFILQDQYGVRIQVASADNLTNPDVNNPWEDFGDYSEQVRGTPVSPTAPVCRIVHKPGHFELYADTSETPALLGEKWKGRISPVQTPKSRSASSRSIARASLPPTTDARGLVDDLELKCQLHFANLKPLSNKKLAAMYELARRAQVDLMGQLHLATIAQLPTEELKSLQVALFRADQILATVNA